MNQSMNVKTQAALMRSVVVSLFLPFYKKAYHAFLTVRILFRRNKTFGNQIFEGLGPKKTMLGNHQWY